MRIFVALRHSANPAAFYGGLWSANFYPALRQLGHEVIESQVDLYPASQFMSVADDFTAEELAIRARLTDQILGEVQKALVVGPIDLFLSYFYNSHFDPSGFDELRRLSVPSVNFYCNSIHQFATVRSIAAKVDFSWHAEKLARDSYLGIGAHPVWVQMAADPAVYRPISGVERSAKACFVGQRYADRDRWMAALVRGGVPVEIFGPGWGSPTAAPSDPSYKDHYLGRRRLRPGSLESYAGYIQSVVKGHGLAGGLARVIRQWQYRRESRRLAPLLRPYARGPVKFDQQARIYSAYEVSISFSNVWADGYPGSRLVPHVRLRDFEAPMCRACYVTGHTDEIAAFYEIGKEIDTYQSHEELVDKVRFYLGHATAADRLREAGYQRSIRDHTWVQRFQQLFAEIGLPIAGYA